MGYKVFWTDEAVLNLEEIIDYLTSKWSQKEVEHFKQKLSKHLDLICSNPLIFPVSEIQPRLRKAVLSKQTSIFYEVKKEEIFIVYLFVNAKSVSRLK